MEVGLQMMTGDDKLKYTCTGFHREYSVKVL